MIEEIVVTGTRIPLQSSEFPTPTTSIGAEVLEQTGTASLFEVLHEYPALVGGVGGSADAGPVTAGRELLNLRGLGIPRTLVLVNGRRHVPGDLGTGAVDIAMIPPALVERVEIITGGASAIYGADAVTGVVNVLLKDDFDGLQLDVMGGISEHGDAERGTLNLAWGRNFADDRANVVVAASYTDKAQVRSSARAFADRSTGFIQNPANTGSDDGIPDLLGVSNDRLRTYSRAGIVHLVNNGQTHPFLPMQELAFQLPLVPDDPFGLGAVPILGLGLQPGQPLFDSLTFDGEGGALRPFASGAPCDPFFCQGGDGISLASFRDIAVPFERVNASLNTRYEFDAVTLRLDARYGSTESSGRGQATVLHDLFLGSFIRLARDNPFVPPALAAEMDARGLTAVPLSILTNSFVTDNEGKTWHVGLAADGDLWRDATFEVYGQYGATHLDSVFPDVLMSRYLQALDATTDAAGSPVCRDPSNGCVPYNPFSGEISGAAFEFAGVNVKSTGRLTQLVFGFSVVGEAVALPAGDVQYAFGAEYRRETSRTLFDDLLTAIDPDTGVGLGLIGLTSSPTQNLVFPSERGKYDVGEAFAEFDVPLLQDRPLAKQVNLSAAARYASYSTIGSDVSYKVGLNWSVGDRLRLRSTFSRAVRAPNITELFGPPTVAGQFVNDPCDASRLDEGSNPANRQANCAALGLPPDFFSVANNTTRPVNQSGNPDVNEEEAHTLTVGAVLTFGRRFSIAVDYWDTDIDDAITVFSPTETLENCVDGPALDPLFCDLVSRDAQGQISSIGVTRINAAEFRASGIDMEVKFQHFFGSGRSLAVDVVGTYMDELTFFQSADDPDSKDERAGASRRPKFRGLLRASYGAGRWNVGWDVNFIGKTRIANDVQPEQFESNRIKAEVYHDLNFRFDARDDLQIYGGVNNVTDNNPPELFNFGDSIYDGVGRYFFAGVRYGVR